MNEDDIKYLLSSIQVDISRYSYTGSKKRTRWINISCPFAPYTHAKGSDYNPSFGITIHDSNRSAYKCLSCGLKGRLAGLPTRLGGYRKVDYSKQRKWAELTELHTCSTRPLPPWDSIQSPTLECNDNGTSNASVIDFHEYPIALGVPYLRKRGLFFTDILAMDIRYDDYQNRVLFPVYDRYGDFAGCTGRSTLSLTKWPRSNPKVRDYFGLDKRKLFLGKRKAGSGPKILVEGLFDFANLVHLGYGNCRAILGTSLTDEKIDILVDEGDPVYFLMDNDIAGWQSLFGTFDDEGELQTENAWAYRLYKELPVWVVPYKNNLNGEDPGSIPNKKVAASMLNNAWLFTGKPPVDSYGEPSTLHPKYL